MVNRLNLVQLSAQSIVTSKMILFFVKSLNLQGKPNLTDSYSKMKLCKSRLYTKLFRAIHEGFGVLPDKKRFHNWRASYGHVNIETRWCVCVCVCVLQVCSVWHVAIPNTTHTHTHLSDSVPSVFCGGRVAIGQLVWNNEPPHIVPEKTMFRQSAWEGNTWLRGYDFPAGYFDFPLVATGASTSLKW